jgi:hypothetical protein
MPLQQALQITNEVLGMMHNFFETAEDAQCIKVANDEVLKSLKHSQLLIRPYMYMLQQQQKASKDMRGPPPELPKR